MNSENVETGNIIGLSDMQGLGLHVFFFVHLVEVITVLKGASQLSSSLKLTLYLDFSLSTK